MIARYGTLILAAQLTFGLSAWAQDHLEPEEGILNQRESRRDVDKLRTELDRRGRAEE